jgi:prolyl oligopeptidase
VQAWTQAQDAYTRAWLAKLPGRDDIKARLAGWYAKESPSYSEVACQGGRYFVLHTVPPQGQPVLGVRTSPDDAAGEKVLVDPNAIDAAGTTAIDFFVPSHDGRRVAVSMSKGGSEIGTLYFYDVDTGQQFSNPIPNVQRPTGGGSVAWNGDATGVWYTRYPKAGERPDADLDFYQQVWFHDLATGKDTYAVGQDFPRIAEVALSSSHDGKYTLAEVENGDGGEYEHLALGPDGQWRQLTHFADRVVHAEFGLHDDLFLISRHGTPRGQVERLDLKQDTRQVVVPQSDGVVEELCPTDHRLYVVDLLGGPSRLRCVDLDTGAASVVPVAPVSAVSGVVRTGADGVLYRAETYLTPPAWYRYDRGHPPVKTAMASTSPVNFDDAEVVREFATSKDGTKVPLNVIRKKGTKLDHHNPTLLYGYGGYGVSMTPHFNRNLRIWLDHGGVYAVANLRGGGEYGDRWHLEGNLTHKQNVFDDFATCARHMIAMGYTQPARLAIQGGSNGGLLMGATLTQHPELFAAVVSQVGIYDMLRVEHDANGSFNVTEYGTEQDPAQFKALYAYSPYHHVKAGTRYPAILLTEGANDGRVNPYHSKKMAAALQAATSSGKPVLLRVNMHAGHGIGTSVLDRIEEQADIYAFLFHELGMK